MRRQKVISTKHILNAPKRLLKFKNLSERLTKWLEILGAYDFEFEHCPGLHHCNADLQLFCSEMYSHPGPILRKVDLNVTSLTVRDARGRSLTYIRNSNGRSMPPWNSPYVTGISTRKSRNAITDRGSLPAVRLTRHKPVESVITSKS